MTWTQTIAVDDLQNNKPALFKKGPKQIVLLRRDQTLYAFDNRCPHEGYPLSEGTFQDGTDDCILTCNWHNWKFSLKQGQNLLGEDHLRVYNTETREGMIWVDLTDKSKEQVFSESLASMKQAFQDQTYDRIARILTRLDFEGIDWRPILKEVVVWTHDRLEYGMTHAYATVAEWLVLYELFAQDRVHRLTCLTEAVDYMAYDSLRHPNYPFTTDRVPYSHGAFVQAIEAEDETKAIGMLLDALDQGLGFEDLEEPLTEAALAHYLDFGHGLIFLVKAGQLIQHLGEEIQEPVLKTLVRRLVYAYREDLIPDYRAYTTRLEEAQALPLLTYPNQEPLARPHGLSVNRSMKWVVEALKTHAPQQAFTLLLEAAGRNLVTYDTRFGEHTDLPVAKNAGWLTVTHGLTFANAVRIQCARYPRLWRQGLLQLACFTGRATPFLDLDQEESPWQVENSQRFFRGAKLDFLDHGIPLPIYPAHYLKTTLAVEEEIPHLPAPVQQTLLAGLNRFLSSPIKQKHGLRLVKQAVALVGRDYRT